MSFADLEDRANAAVMQRLSNARALRVGAAADIPVIFDRAQVETSVGVSATMPMATALDSDITGWASNSTQVTIRTVTYLVHDIRPDGTGMSLLLLEAQ